MKIILHPIVVTLLLFSLCANVVSQSALAKKEERQKQYQQIVQLIEDGSFLFDAERAFPMGGQSVDLTTNYGFIKMNGDSVQAHLPFFGRAYSVDFGGGGINFKGPVNDLEIKRNDKKMRVSCLFEVDDREVFRVRLDVGYSGDATASVISQNRSSISYSGKVSGESE